MTKVSETRAQRMKDRAATLVVEEDAKRVQTIHEDDEIEDDEYFPPAPERKRGGRPPGQGRNAPHRLTLHLESEQYEQLALRAKRQFRSMHSVILAAITAELNKPV